MLSQRAQRTRLAASFVSVAENPQSPPNSLLYGCRLLSPIMAPSFDTLTEQDLHEEEEEEVDFSGAYRKFSRLGAPL